MSAGLPFPTGGLVFPITTPRMAIIYGPILNVDGSACNFATVTFNSLVQQVINGVAVQPIITSRRTDSTGLLQPVSLPWGLTVVVKVSWNGVTYPPSQAIVPQMEFVTLSQLMQGPGGD